MLFCFGFFFGMMPSLSSCDRAHSCMDLSHALAQVQIHQSCCSHKHPAEAKRREEDWKDRLWTTAQLVKWAKQPTWWGAPGHFYPVLLACSSERCNVMATESILFIYRYIYVIYIKYIEIIIYIYYTLSYNIYIYSHTLGLENLWRRPSMVLCY